MLETGEWHARYQQQARWTRPLRDHIFSRYPLRSTTRVLEVGCGTGAILDELATRDVRDLHGLDIDDRSLAFAQKALPGIFATCGNAYALPYAPGCFDLVICHYLLLWLEWPLKALEEMCRVTRRGGLVMALAEPDYGGRIDYPPELEVLGDLQYRSLERQGAQPRTGRSLGAIFHEAGLQGVETGVLGGQWDAPPDPDDFEREWQVIKSDLHDLLAEDKIAYLQERDRLAWLAGTRVLYIPTFYALGTIP
jgi:SAM-dependent methyltransferase